MPLAPLPLHDSRQLAPLLVSIFTVLLASVAIGLRIQGHRITKAPFKIDDYTIFGALLLAWVSFIVVIIATSYGGIGLHTQDIAPGYLTTLLKCRIAIFILWHANLSLVRISLLSLYIRIFDHKTNPSVSLRKNSSWFHWTAYIGIALGLAFLVVVILEEMLLCRPLAVNWDISITTYRCGDGDKAYVATGVITLLLDVLVIVLPIPRIWNLQLKLRDKIALSLLFSCGTIICILTIVRIVSKATFYWEAEDPTYTIWKIIMWSQLEPNVAIVCACVPLMRPVFATHVAPHLSHRNQSKSSKASLEKYSHTSRMDTATDIEGQPRRVQNTSLRKKFGLGRDPEPEIEAKCTVMGESKAKAEDGGRAPQPAQTRRFQVKHYNFGAFTDAESQSDRTVKPPLAPRMEVGRAPKPVIAPMHAHTESSAQQNRKLHDRIAQDQSPTQMRPFDLEAFALQDKAKHSSLF